MEESLSTARRTLICPLCEAGELRGFGRNAVRCASCGCVVGGLTLVTLRQISGLPDAAGLHPCECGHPEMRLLPDGVYRCPACGSEVTPVSADPATRNSSDHSAAYWSGWLDGRYAEARCFAENRRLGSWDAPSDRLDYYRGHRAGHEARLRKERLVEAS